MPRRSKVRQRKSVMLKGSNIPVTVEELFDRVFWKSRMLSHEALKFWECVRDSPEGFPVQDWRQWIKQRGISVGAYYHIIKGLRGVGMIERRAGRYHVSSGFIRELEQMVLLYSSISRFEPRI